MDGLAENARNRDHPGEQKSEPPLTVVGAYLHFGPDLLPPLVGSHLQELANHWETKDSRRIDAAIKFIETTTRLAVAQTGVLVKNSGDKVVVPSDERMATCLDTLAAWRSRFGGWSWCNYLSEEALGSFRGALKIRNEERHTHKPNDPTRTWAALRVPLQYAMDVAAYWVRHPLCINLRYRRDGWNAELLAGTSYLRKRRRLPERLDFPGEAVQEGVWHNVWRIDGKEPEPKPLCWDGWLEPDPQSERPWWVPIYQDSRNRKGWLDLDSGEKAVR